MNIFKILSVFITAAVVITCATISVAFSSLNRDVGLLRAQLTLMDNAIVEAYSDAIEESLRYAPQEKSIYQLRGDAQTEAQRLLDRLTTIHNIPQYRLAGIRFRGALGNGAAGTATDCEDAFGVYGINLNEILFLRNYRTFIDEIIPHEVAHVMVCMLGGFEENAHGEEWKQVMLDIGFKKPSDFYDNYGRIVNGWRRLQTHTLDVGPVHRYQADLASRLDVILEGGP